MLRHPPRFLALISLATVCTAAVRAGQPIEEGSRPAASSSVPLTLFSLRSSYVFESDFARGTNASGDAWSNKVEFSRRFPVSLPWPSSPDGGWYLRLGAEYNRFDFSQTGNLPLPDTLQSFAGIIALEYIVRGQVGIVLQTAPGFYFENDVTSDAFDAPTKLGVSYRVNDRFFLLGGVTYSNLRSYPFLPALGFVWRVDDQWTILALVPEPRVIYRPSETLAFWAGGELAGGAFRTDNDNSRPANLRNAALSYSELRAGGGVTIGNPQRMSLELGGGYAFHRKFDYHRAEDVYNTAEGAPYVKASLRAAF